MKGNVFISFVMLISLLVGSCMEQTTPEREVLLKDNWAILSSVETSAGGDLISTGDYHPEGWYPTTMPSTVLATLVRNKVYPDPYFGTNMDSLPGYVPGNVFEMPEGSPFKVPWWFRGEFTIPESYRGKHVWLHIPSINYQANIWLNGHLIADTSAIEGAYRLYDLDITKYAVSGDTNYLALEIFPPEKLDLTITWVDWNPTPPDRGMGIWYDISLHATGPVTITHPHVVTDLNVPVNDTARITISAELKNSETKPVTGWFRGQIGTKIFSKKITLDAGETKEVSFTPADFPTLIFTNPHLWWPHTVGPQNLYDLRLTFTTNGEISDQKKQQFGIREISAWMNNFDGHHTKVFQINGKNILIRGGGYVEDMMLRPSEKNIKSAIAYAKQMNLNTLRMEAPRGPDELYDLCDKEGILLMVGWCCCSTWERWSWWTPHTADIAELSWKDQILRLRNHPSVFTWLYGSDNYPPENVERRYIDVLDQYDGTRPYESSATQDSSAIDGFTGFWMGPWPDVYAYEVPSYWYGKLEFNTEAGPAGEQIPPLESLRKMMPEDELWPGRASWDLRLHPRFYPQARKALFSRYGKPENVEEYSMKSQVFQKEAVRAMFEAFARNKYKASGIIYWMYNSAWPSLYWQLYDYYLAPNGAFYGAKKGCEPLHIQFSYDDSTVYVVNSFYKSFNNLQASVRFYNFDMEEKLSKDIPVNIGPDGKVNVTTIDFPDDHGDVCFLKLNLKDDSGNVVSSNFYWLSDQGDRNADFTALDRLPETDVKVSILSLESEGDTIRIKVNFENQSSSLAFAINPAIKEEGSGDLVTPVFWDDNYFSLLPGEQKTLSVRFNRKDLQGEKPQLVVSGWNVSNVVFPLNE